MGADDDWQTCARGDAIGHRPMNQSGERGADDDNRNQRSAAAGNKSHLERGSKTRAWGRRKRALGFGPFFEPHSLGSGRNIAFHGTASLSTFSTKHH
jgi:hypothetical protein